MKHYNKETYLSFVRDIGRHKKKHGNGLKDPLTFMKLVLKFALPVNRGDNTVGVFDFNDILSSACLGLMEGWNKINWVQIETSPEPFKKTANYLSSYIDGEIKHNLRGRTLGIKDEDGIDVRDGRPSINSIGVNIPISNMKKTLKEEVEDQLFGNWKYLFKLDDYSPGTMLRYIDLIEDREEPYQNMILNDKLTDLLYRLPENERLILDYSFGLNRGKMTIKQIAFELNMSEIGVKKAKTRALNRLNTEENSKLFEDFL